MHGTAWKCDGDRVYVCVNSTAASADVSGRRGADRRPAAGAAVGRAQVAAALGVDAAAAVRRPVPRRRRSARTAPARPPRRPAPLPAQVGPHPLPASLMPSESGGKVVSDCVCDNDNSTG